MTPTKLKHAQSLLGLTNREMAARFSISYTTIKDAKSGRTNLNQDTAANIERAAKRANGGKDIG